MIRRSHKKSRKGCHECKRRHMKCDETRPLCTNCTVAERVCDYGSKSVTATPMDDSFSPQASSNNPPPAPARVTLQLGPTSNTQQADHITAAINHKTDRHAGSDVNLNHMELLIHYSLDISAPELDDDAITFGTKLLLSKAIDAPWLLYEVLAISARHLAVVKPAGSSAFYLTTSMQLQTRAIELFNSANLHIDASNCVAALMFSSTLARHVLVDTLANLSKQDGAGEGVDAAATTFIQHYIRYVQIHRGLRAIASSAWPHISESEGLHVFLSRAEGLESRPTRGHELDDLRENLIIQRSPSYLDEDSKEACLNAIRYLQLGLDEFADANSRQNKYQLVFLWSLLNTPAFTELVRQHQPEALVILGHYAVLLHYARDLWQIGTSGAFLFQAVCELLPNTEEWARHLLWPRTIIKGS